MDVGSNPDKMLFFSSFFYLVFFFKVRFLCIMHMLRIFLFPSYSMLHLLSLRLWFFIVFNLDLFVNREDSLMS